tara:strand:- start:251 stop:628 length:378 start_codon:yes stop_codon:yes gene_type:complete
MENKNNPLSPHLQIYRWHISSLLSITHRIVGIINFFSIILISSVLIFTTPSINIFQILNQSLISKFLLIFLCWSFSFQILNEIRHLAWDMGYGYDLKTSKITGVIIFIGSFIFAISFYIIGRDFL